MWDLNQGDEPIQEFCGHELVVNGLAISPGTYTRTLTQRVSLTLGNIEMLSVHVKIKLAVWDF